MDIPSTHGTGDLEPDHQVNTPSYPSHTDFLLPQSLQPPTEVNSQHSRQPHTSNHYPLETGHIIICSLT